MRNKLKKTMLALALAGLAQPVFAATLPEA